MFFSSPGWFNPHGLIKMKKMTMKEAALILHLRSSVSMFACLYSYWTWNIWGHGLLLYSTSCNLLFLYSVLWMTLFCHSIRIIYMKLGELHWIFREAGLAFFLTFWMLSVFLTVRATRLLNTVQFLSRPKCISDKCR